MLHFLGRNVDAVNFWGTLFAVSIFVILALIFHVLYSLKPAQLRAKIASLNREVMRREMDRMAEYEDGLAESASAVRQPFELGAAAMANCQWDQAIAYFEEAMMQAKGAELVALFNLTGICRYTQGLLDKALADFEESARLADQFHDEDGKPPALGNIGVIWHDKGELDKALDYKQEALAKARVLGDQWSEAVYLGNIGNILHDKKDLDGALQHHRDALAMSRFLGDNVGTASDLTGIGSDFRDKGVLKEALQFDLKSLSLARRIGHRLGVVTNLSHIASIYRYQGRLDAALRYDEEALAVARKIGYRLGAAVDLGNIGLILTRQRKHAQAVPRLAQSLMVLLTAGVADGPRQALTALAKCEDKLGRKRFEALLREAKLDDADIADVSERIDEIRRARPEPKAPGWF